MSSLPRYDSLSLEAIDDAFGRCVAQGGGVSTKAVLRIAREQLMARDNPGLNHILAVIVGAVFLLSLVGNVFLDPASRDFLKKVSIGTGVLLAIQIFGIARSRQLLRTRLHEERAIRAKAVAALIQIASRDDFEPPRLEPQQRRLLQELLKKGDASVPPALQALADS